MLTVDDTLPSAPKMMVNYLHHSSGLFPSV